MTVNTEMEKRLLLLARRIKQLDKAIIKEVSEKGKENSSLRTEFLDTRAEIREILSDIEPLDDIRDPEVRDTLRKIPKGD